jgi:hypothetical protein
MTTSPIHVFSRHVVHVAGGVPSPADAEPGGGAATWASPTLLWTTGGCHLTASGWQSHSPRRTIPDKAREQECTHAAVTAIDDAVSQGSRSISRKRRSSLRIEGTFVRSGRSPRRIEGTFVRSGRSPRRIEGTFVRSGRSPRRIGGTFVRSGRSPRRIEGTFVRSGRSPRRIEGTFVRSGRSTRRIEGTSE